MKENEKPQAFSRCGHRVEKWSVLKLPRGPGAFNTDENFRMCGVGNAVPRMEHSACCRAETRH
jgi:hypothetical protein